LDQHVLAVRRQMVPADDVSLQFGEEYVGVGEPLPKRHFKVQIAQTRVADPK
jgi:hypothetical protein